MDSVEGSQCNVPFWYLSVLLSSLCINSYVRAQVREKLQGQTLEPLLEAVEEFLVYHQKVDDQLHRGEGEEEGRPSFVRRVEDLISQLRDATDP